MLKEREKPISSTSYELLLTIDPGITGTGLALWTLKDWDKLSYPVWCGNIRPKGKGTWEDRAKNIVHEFSNFCLLPYTFEQQYGKITKAIIEEPKFFADSAKGEMNAKTNSLGKLYMLVGMYMSVLWENGVEVNLVRVDKWKGTLPKNVVIQRIKRRLPEIEKRLNPKTHSWDAIGIALGVRDYLSMRS